MLVTMLVNRLTLWRFLDVDNCDFSLFAVLLILKRDGTV